MDGDFFRGEQKPLLPLKNAASYDAWLHDLAGSILRGLASLQGRVVNDVNEEQPGKIVHEYWDVVPQRYFSFKYPIVGNRYYGTVDATFLFVITLARVDAYFHDASLLDDLWPSIEAAVHWMLEWSDRDQDGLVEYGRRNPEGYGLEHQVWKDSSSGIQPRDHEPLEHPLAWIEVQGYAWAAYASYLELAGQRQSLDPERHAEIQRRMENLQQGLQRFWLADEHFPALLLDGKKRPAPVVSSNPGHLLWSGMLAREQATQVGHRLMQPDLCTPWGIRTLSEQAFFYNPFGYQNGAVWAFDNAVAVIGLRRYHLEVEAREIAQRILRALQASGNPVELYLVVPASHVRSPKLEQAWILMDYLESASVQAWTTAAMIYLTSLLLVG